MGWESANGYMLLKVGGRNVYQHREVWERHNGSIPSGCYIHHRDGNRKNNELANLELVTPAAHRQMHNAVALRRTLTCVDCGAETTRIIQDARPPVCLKCQSKRAEARRKEPRVCRCCGKSFVSRRGWFCSQRCVNLAGRWRGQSLQLDSSA